MIKAELVLDRGLLKSLRISGHAGAGPKGMDIVCAAVSVLARTAYTSLSKQEGVTVKGQAPERGEFWMEADYSGSQNMEFISGAVTFLKEGLVSVSAEYPDFCNVSISIEERQENGS